eukprot:scaffold90312_cov28-Prasinocladus_malaysianus.AAC.2
MSSDRHAVYRKGWQSICQWRCMTACCVRAASPPHHGLALLTHLRRELLLPELLCLAVVDLPLQLLSPGHPFLVPEAFPLLVVFKSLDSGNGPSCSGQKVAMNHINRRFNASISLAELSENSKSCASFVTLLTFKSSSLEKNAIKQPRVQIAKSTHRLRPSKEGQIEARGGRKGMMYERKRREGWMKDGWMHGRVNEEMNG